LGQRKGWWCTFSVIYRELTDKLGHIQIRENVHEIYYAVLPEKQRTFSSQYVNLMNRKVSICA
jgi:hypothetical protein